MRLVTERDAPYRDPMTVLHTIAVALMDHGEVTIETGTQESAALLAAIQTLKKFG